jgi:hypothetical protein
MVSGQLDAENVAEMASVICAEENDIFSSFSAA